MPYFRKAIIILVFIGCMAFFMLYFSASVNSNSTGAPPAKTGSPYDVSNCSDCHASFPQTIQGIITSTVPLSGYVPGNTYTITVSLTNAGFSGINKFGFEVSPQDLTGNGLGTLVVTDIAQTQLVGSGNYITHTMNGTTPDSMGYKTWTFNWIAPASGTGNVTFYGSFLLANGNAINTGDQGLLSTLTVLEDTTLTAGVLDAQQKSYHLYPNPCMDKIAIFSNYKQYHEAEILIYSINGEKLIQRKQYDFQKSEEINVAGLANGFYFIIIKTKQGKTIEKIIKN